MFKKDDVKCLTVAYGQIITGGYSIPKGDVLEPGDPRFDAMFKKNVGMTEGEVSAKHPLKVCLKSEPCSKCEPKDAPKAKVEKAPEVKAEEPSEAKAEEPAKPVKKTRGRPRKKAEE